MSDRDTYQDGALPQGATLSKKINLLKVANQAYANGQPFLSDPEYDALWQEIHAQDPANPHLYHTARDPQSPTTRPHATKIMGTQKAFETRELKPFHMRFSHLPWVLEPKYDGLAAVIYKNPPDSESNYSLILEGDSISGKDVSHHLPYILTPGFDGPSCSVELIIPRRLWRDEWGANPRNVCSGWISSGSKPSEHPSIIEAVPHNRGPLSHRISVPKDMSLSDLETLLLKLYEHWNSIYPCDGIMLKLADPADRLRASHNGTISLWSIAWKPPIQTAETTITGIEWNISKHGRLIPTLIYEPVPICDTTNTRVTGNNARWVSERGLGVGARVSIGKAGEIIPKLLHVYEEAPQSLPEVCPICGDFLQWENNPTQRVPIHLVCHNPTCIGAQHEKITYFYTKDAFKLDTIGPVRVLDLLNHPKTGPVLLKKPWALIDPYSYEIVDSIYDVLGPKVTAQYLDNLEQIQGHHTIVHFMAGLALPHLGYRTALSLIQQMRGHKIKARVNKQAMNSFVKALSIVRDAQAEMKNFKFGPVPEPPKILYCITGTLSMPRDEMIRYLDGYGWHIMHSVTKNVDLLIVGNLEHVSAKLRRARELDVPLVYEHDLPKWLDSKTGE